MTTPASGPISFSQIRDELDWNTSISIGSLRPRRLANVASGTIKSSDLYNKTAIGHSFTNLFNLPSTSWGTQGSAYTNGKYFYSANNGASPNNTSYLYKSDTGTSFTQVSSITSGAIAGYSNFYQGILCGVGYGPSGQDVYLAYGNSFYIQSGGGQHQTPIIQASTDGGNTFSTIYAPGSSKPSEYNFNYGVLGNNTALFCSATSGDAFVQYKFPSPGTATTYSITPPSGSRLNLQFVNNAFFLFTQDTTAPYNRYLYRSTSGDTGSWTAVIGLSPQALNVGVFYNGTYFIAYYQDQADSMKLKYFVSPDGISWTASSTASTPTASGYYPLNNIAEIKVIPELGAYYMSANNLNSSGTYAYYGSVWKSTDMANWTNIFQSPTTDKYCGLYSATYWTGLSNITNGRYGKNLYYGDSTGYYLALSANGTNNFKDKLDNPYGDLYDNGCTYLLGITSDNSKPLVAVTYYGLFISQR